MDGMAISPTRLTFGARDENKLVSALERVDRVTTVVPAMDLLGAGMNSCGEVGSMRFTTWGLYQVCRMICPGLYRAIVEMVSDGRTNSLLTAISIFNQALSLRSRDRLGEQRFLCNGERRTIDAMVSSRYRFFKNLDLYRRAKTAFPGRGFGSAVLSGRWLMMRFYNKGPILRLDDSPYYTGFHLSNHEGGQSSLVLLNMLLRAKGSLGFVVPARSSNRIKHSGATMTHRFQRRLRQVLDYTWNAGTLLDQVRRSSASGLGLGLLEQEAESRRQRAIRWVLQKTGITKSLSTTILASAIVQPHGASSPASLLSLNAKMLRERTAYDLAIAAARCAKECAILLREKVEKAAFNIMTGQIQFPNRNGG